jgi:phospholipid/cholesterol/gamma-HCH transport system substrate-binding protein
MRGPRHKLPNWAVGLILIVVIAAGSLLAYTKTLPWTHNYTVKAVFSTSQNIATNSPVRIAGVNVGKVTDVEHLTASNSSDLTAATGTPSTTDAGGPPGQSEAVVTMEISDNGLPIHQDATMALRPRLFLEGNLFVDLHPGTPESPDLADGGMIPLAQTSVSVQLDQVLSTLQSDVRSNLQVLLHSLGDAFIKYNGAEGLNEAYRTSPGAFKSTALVNEAFLGTQPNDLSNLVRNLDSTVRALDANKSQLQGLIVNFERVTAATAAQDTNLARAVSLLPGTLDAARPAFAALNGAFPAVRAFAREALPGVRSTPAALDASMPFLRQLRGLVSKPELRGLVHDLRPAIPDLARLSQRSVPFLNQGRSLASCTNQVLTPWLQSNLPDPDGAAVNNGISNSKVYPQGAFAAEGFGGISGAGDANGQPSRVLGSSGPQILSFPAGGGAPPSFATSAFPVLGSRPAVQSSAKTPFRPDVACETQKPPNLSSGPAGPAPPQTKVASQAPSPIAKSLQDASMKYLTSLGKAHGILHPEAGAAGKAAKRPTPQQTAKARALIADGTRAWRSAIHVFHSGGGG